MCMEKVKNKDGFFLLSSIKDVINAFKSVGAEVEEPTDFSAMTLDSSEIQKIEQEAEKRAKDADSSSAKSKLRKTLEETVIDSSKGTKSVSKKIKDNIEKDSSDRTK